MKLLILLIIINCGGKLFSQVIDDYFVETNGVINDIDSDSNYVYFAGQFTQVNKYSGCGVVFSNESTKIDYNNKYKIYGTVNDAIPDGNGGWYICGNFTRIGEYRIGSLAHIYLDGTLDTNFYITPNQYSNNYSKLILDNEYIYILNGGIIIKVNKFTNEKIELSFPNDILDFDIDDNYFYFSTEKNYYTNKGMLDYVDYKVYRVSKQSNEIDSTFFIDKIVSNYGNLIKSRIVKLNKNFLYYVTDYLTIQRIDINTKIIDENWKIEVDGNYPKIYDIKFDDNNIYLAGYFSELNSNEVNNFAKINLSTLEINKDWVANEFASVGSFDLDDDHIYFYHTGIVQKLEKINKFTGEVDSNFNYLNKEFYANYKEHYPNYFNVISKSNDRLFLGGNFSTFNEGYSLTNLFRYNIKENKVDTNFNLNINYRDVVKKIKISDDYLFLHGKFYDRSKEFDNRYFIIKNNLLNNKLEYLLKFDYPPNIKSIEYNKEYVYLGGDFKISDDIKNLIRFNKYINLIDSSWTPNPNGTVEALKLDKDTLYVGGKFNEIYDKDIVYLAKLDIANSTLIDDFNLGFIYNPKLKIGNYENNGANLIELRDDKIYVNLQTETKENKKISGLIEINKQNFKFRNLNNANGAMRIADLEFNDNECFAVDFIQSRESIFKIDLENFQIDTKWYCEIKDEGDYPPNLNFAGDYLYYITSGKISNYNRRNLFKFNNKDISLEKPVLQFPENNSFNIYAPTLLITTPVKNATRYYTVFSLENDFKYTNHANANTDGIGYYRFSNPSRTVYWKTQASNEFTTSEWSDVYTFKTRFVAPKILNSVLEDTLYLNYDSAFIEWEDFGESFKYLITADEDNESKNRYIDSISIDENKFIANNFKDSTNYHFNIYASESDTVSFPAYLYLKVLYKKMPTTPIKIFPEKDQHVSKVDLKLYWKNTRDADFNHLQVSKDSEFNDLIVNDENIIVNQFYNDDVFESISFDLENLDSNTTYYWRVKAKNKLGESEFSDIWSFTTDEKFLSVSNSIEKQNSFSIYPNPTNTILNIVAKEKLGLFNKIEIYNLEGKLIFEKTGKLSNVSIDVSNFPLGTYLIKIHTKENIYSDKFIKN